MAHLTQVAATMQSKGITGFKKFLAQTIGRGYAKSELWKITEQVENSQSGETQWSYEDGPSNLAGMDFYLDYYGGDNSQEIIEAFDEFFNDAKATNPDKASNWEDMQSTPQSERKFKQNKSLNSVKPEKEEKK